MERITLTKNSRVRTFVMSGAECMGYNLAIRTNCVDTPIHIYVNRDEHILLIYNCGLKRDELLIIDYSIPAKLQVIINEYKGFNDLPPGSHPGPRRYSGWNVFPFGQQKRSHLSVDRRKSLSYPM